MPMSGAHDLPTEAIDPSLGRGRVLLVLLITWFAANALTHVIVAVVTGGILYQLPLLAFQGAEASIYLLNFLLPILAVRYVLKEPLSFAGSFGWRWTGWKVPALACGGFVAFMLLCIVTNWLFANRIISYGAPGMAGPVSRMDYLVCMLVLLIFPAMGEETMFRGLLQTRLTAMYGATAGIMVPAALFAIRHHPSDIYFGIVNHVPPAGWANRAAQLYLMAVVFGLVRHFARSTWASWMLHMTIIILIIITGGFLRGLLS